MKSVVISQPMFFPWIGMLEQIRLADVYVHYDDVQFSKGSFTNRVQVKGPSGSHWLTVPLRQLSLGQAIRDVALADAIDWQPKHLASLRQYYDRAPFRDDMLEIVQRVYHQPFRRLGDLAIASMVALCEYFGLADSGRFLHSGSVGLSELSGSERVLGIVKKLDGDRYITGHGARKYLDHSLFEKSKISVEYMNYQRLPYPQLYGAFDPHVSALDLVANCGREGRSVICSGTTPWAAFLESSQP